MVRVDVHVKVLDDRVKSVALDRGLDAIVYAPHFTPWPAIVDRAAHFSDERLTVIPARELFTGPWNDRKHVLALDLDAPIPDFRDLDWTMAELERQDACVIAPHPAFFTISLSAGDIHRYDDLIDAVEVYNPKFLPWHGPRARRIARDVDRPMVASSYAHLRTSVGAVAVDLDASDRSVPAIVDAIRTGRIDVIDGPAPLPTMVGELAHLLYENTLHKLPRLRGATHLATHPSQALYRE